MYNSKNSPLLGESYLFLWSRWTAQPDLKFGMYFGLTLNKRPTCHYLLSAGISDVWHHAQLNFHFKGSFIILILFHDYFPANVCVCTYVLMYVCITQVYLVPTEASRGYEIPGTEVADSCELPYGCLRIEPTRKTTALNPWEISPAPQLNFW